MATAASSTRTLARQMSRPVPSPSMKGTIGRSGTSSFWPLIVIFWPPAGGTGFALLGVVMGWAALAVG